MKDSLWPIRSNLDGAAQSQPEPTPDEPELGGPIHVLVIDDEIELLTSLERVLGRRDMEVFTASNGRHGLEILADELIDVVVLDCKMRGMDGFEVLRRIKGNHPSVEVILLTGHPTVDAALRGMRLGARDYLVKPPVINELVARIRAAFAKRAAALLEAQQATLRDLLKGYPE
jgi:DNA-binding response OmpR family regulator